MLFPLCLAALAATLAAASSAGLQRCVESAFGAGAKDRIVRPSDATYTDARVGEAIQFDQLPLLIAYAKDASEVPQLINCAKRAGIKAVPRSGGHHFMAYSALSGTLVIDITHIDHVDISPDKSTAHVGAGIRFGPLYTALGKQGRDFPGGICPSVGLSGFLGAGGFNMQMRQLGLGVDHVLAAAVVLADGRTVTASPAENADLFWALRGGGGGSYGVVVAWTLQLSAFPRSSMVLLRWNEPGTRAAVASRFLAWAPRADRAFMSQVNVHKNRSEVVGWCLGCPLAKAQALVRRSGLLDIGKPEVHISGNCSSANSRMVGFIVDECIPDAKAAQLAPLALNYPQQPFARIGNYPQFAWNETTKDPGAPNAQPWSRFIRISKSFFVQKSNELGNDAVQNLVARITQLPDETAGWGEWHAWNIAGPSNDAAFAWREEAYAHLEFIVTGSDDAKKQQSYHDWASKLERYLRPLVGPASYAGYMDSTISTDPLTSYYGDNVGKLSSIKRKYDPFEFFDNPLGIKLSYGS